MERATSDENPLKYIVFYFAHILYPNFLCFPRISLLPLCDNRKRYLHKETKYPQKWKKEKNDIFY